MQVADIESPVPPHRAVADASAYDETAGSPPPQAPGLETASGDPGGPAPATADEWEVAVAMIVAGVDSAWSQAETASTPEPAAPTPSPSPVPGLDPAAETEAVSTPGPRPAEAPLTTNGVACIADTPVWRHWYLPAATPVLSTCPGEVALRTQAGQQTASAPPAPRNPASFTVEAPRARVPEEPRIAPPPVFSAYFLLLGA